MALGNSFLKTALVGGAELKERQGIPVVLPRKVVQGVLRLGTQFEGAYIARPSIQLQPTVVIPEMLRNTHRCVNIVIPSVHILSVYMHISFLSLCMLFDQKLKA